MGSPKAAAAVERRRERTVMGDDDETSGLTTGEWVGWTPMQAQERKVYGSDKAEGCYEGW
jgi:hypothetical protein